jgi:hypothetical protein
MYLNTKGVLYSIVSPSSAQELLFTFEKFIPPDFLFCTQAKTRRFIAFLFNRLELSTINSYTDIAPLKKSILRN